MPIFGIDLGGTKIEGVVLESVVEPRVLYRHRIATERERGYEHILGRINSLVELMAEAAGHFPETLGICTPGVIDPSDNLMKNSNTVCLNGKPFRDDLADFLGIPLRMANDANCFALAETRLGAVAEEVPTARVSLGLIMGTGVGGGVIIDGKVLEGRHGIGGEWGHIFLDESGGPCYCGQVGCVETVISGTGLERWYRSKSGQVKDLKQIYRDFERDSDPWALKTMERLIQFFGRGLATVLNILDPDVVVIGGGVGNIPLLYTRGRESVQKHLFNHRLETPFLRPTLGDSAGVFGAALLVEREKGE